jgi:hypothetical protein
MAKTEALATEDRTRKPLLTLVPRPAEVQLQPATSVGGNSSSLNGRGPVPTIVASEVSRWNSSGSLAEVREVLPLGLSIKEFKANAAIKDGLPDDTVRFSTYFDNGGSATDVLRLFGTPQPHSSTYSKVELATPNKVSTETEKIPSIQEVKLENGSIIAYDGKVMRGSVVLQHSATEHGSFTSQLVSDYAVRELRQGIDSDSNVTELISPLEYADGKDENGILNRITTATVVQIKDGSISLRNVRVNDTSKGAKEILTIARELGTRKKTVIDGKGAESDRSGLPRAYTVYSTMYARDHVDGADRPFGKKLRSVK